MNFVYFHCKSLLEAKIKFFCMLWDAIGCYGMPWNAKGCNGMLWIVMELPLLVVSKFQLHLASSCILSLSVFIPAHVSSTNQIKPKLFQPTSNLLQSLQLSQDPFSIYGEVSFFYHTKKTQCDKKGRNVSSIETFFGQKTLPEQASEKGGTFYALVYVSRPVSKEYTI